MCAIGLESTNKQRRRSTVWAYVDIWRFLSGHTANKAEIRISAVTVDHKGKRPEFFLSI